MTLEQLSTRLMEDIGNKNLSHKYEDKEDFIIIKFYDTDHNISITYKITKSIFNKIKK